jgi:hypothetical protein
MSSSWKLLGSFESADEMTIFGVSTAMIISAIQLDHPDDIPRAL